MLHAEPGADGEADELRGPFDEAEDPASGRVVEAEDVAVEEGAEDREAGDRGREEREHAVDAAEAVDLPAHAPALGERRRRFLGLAVAAVSAPVSFFSCTPRRGSGSVAPASTRSTVGIANTKNGTRQLNVSAM